jgi:polyphosphate kinase
LKILNLENANFVAGGSYHNLKDLASMPLEGSSLFYNRWNPIPVKLLEKDKSLLENIFQKDIILNTPYHSYDLVLRFFNEAAADESVEEIYVTLYRVAQQSKIGDALISAAKNGKKVTVLVELKARFDETNNIKWSKKMKKRWN